MSWSCYLTILSFAVPFSFCLQPFPASGSFLTSWLFTSSDQNIGASASALPVNIQDWLPLQLTGLISLQSKRLSRVFSNTKFKSITSSSLSLLYSPTITSICGYWKTTALARRTFVGKVMSLLFNMPSRLAKAFLPRSKCLLIPWLQSIFSAILKTKQIKSIIVCIVSPFVCH